MSYTDSKIDGNDKLHHAFVCNIGSLLMPNVECLLARNLKQVLESFSGSLPFNFRSS